MTTWIFIGEYLIAKNEHHATLAQWQVGPEMGIPLMHFLNACPALTQIFLNNGTSQSGA